MAARESKHTHLVELYFSDPERPPGRRFLGAVLMRPGPGLPDDNGSLVRRAWGLGINPGGEVLFYDVDSDSLNGFTAGHLDRLLSEAECLALGLFKKRGT
jgi:hypothetical protein